jgi:glycosyltransferase involved in cell wall biosynthesis
VKFHGSISEAEKQRLLWQAHLLVFTSHREGWGLIVNEAAAFGTPSVGYDAPGVRESIGESSQLAPSGDTTALAERALTLLGDRARYDRQRRRAWQRAKKMSYDRTARKFLKDIT